MSEYGLQMFGHKDKPDHVIGWEMYQSGLRFNNQIDIDNIVKGNENFVTGKQWENVDSKGLPTPQFNVLKRVVGFITATITTDNIKATCSALANTVNTGNYTHMANIVNDEFEALTERNSIPSLVREFTRDAAVRGDGCLYTYWDSEIETGQKAKGAIVTEVMQNTRVFFGNPNDRNVQTQPWIIIAKRDMVRNVRKRAKENGIKDWLSIKADSDETTTIDSAKLTFDKCTVLLLLWRDDETDTIWAYEFTQSCDIKKPFDMGISLYPITWLNWDAVSDCYHGQAMVTGLIPNQIFINKAWAMSMLSIMKSAFPKYVYDKTKVAQWDNRVGSAIATIGDVNNVAKVIDPAVISPQVSQLIELAVSQTEESLGATSVALGDTRPDNTSAIIALQRAAATPSEMTKQNLYKSIEDLFRICLDFMAEYYGKRYVDVPLDDEARQAVELARLQNPTLKMPETMPQLFDFKELKTHPMTLKLDVGASTYYSEIAAIQTLDNLLRDGHITIGDYLERIPDDYIPGRRALIETVRQREREQQQAMQAQMGIQPQGAPMTDMSVEAQQTAEEEEIPNTGGGYGRLQRAINEAGDTKGIL